MEQEARSLTDPIAIDAPTQGSGAPPEPPESPPNSTPKGLGYFLPIAYVVFGSLSGPLVFIYLSVVLGKVRPPDILDQQHPEQIIMIVWGTILAVLLLGNIVRSFYISRKADPYNSVHSMMITQYGMMPFLFLHTISTPISVIILIYFMPPEQLRLALLYAIMAPFLFVLPGAFYGIQVVRLSCREKIIHPFTAIFHGIAQFIPVIGFFDAAYLSAVKWQTGRKVTLAVIVIVLLFIFLYLMNYPHDIGFFAIIPELFRASKDGGIPIIVR